MTDLKIAFYAKGDVPTEFWDLLKVVEERGFLLVDESQRKSLKLGMVYADLEGASGILVDGDDGPFLHDFAGNIYPNIQSDKLGELLEAWKERYGEAEESNGQFTNGQ